MPNMPQPEQTSTMEMDRIGENLLFVRKEAEGFMFLFTPDIDDLILEDREDIETIIIERIVAFREATFDLPDDAVSDKDQS